MPVFLTGVIGCSVRRDQFEGRDNRAVAGIEPAKIAPALQQIGKIRGERIAGLAGGDDHARIRGRCQIGDDPQPGAEHLFERALVVMDDARPAVERVVRTGGRDRDP